MRFKLAVSVILALVLCCALTSSANSVTAKSKSNYGDSPYLTDVGSSETSDGATLQLVCPVSLGCPSAGAADLLEVTFPDALAAPGTLFDINGVDATAEVDLVCDYSLIGACVGSTLTGNQATCVATIGGTSLSSTSYQVALPNCSSLGFSGTDITLLFTLSGDFQSIPSSVSVTPGSAMTAPEPSSLVLMAAGILALVTKRRVTA